MCEASREMVPIEQVQALASRKISGITGAEAGYVTSGAAAALTMAAAAAIAGLDLAKMDRLPCTDDMPSEVIICRSHRNGYDHAIRAAGARLVEVGLDDRAVGVGVRRPELWEIDKAINEMRRHASPWLPVSWNHLYHSCHICQHHSGTFSGDTLQTKGRRKPAPLVNVGPFQDRELAIRAMREEGRRS